MRFAEPRDFPERVRFYSFRLYEKNGEYPRGLRTSGLPGRIQSSIEEDFSRAFGGTCRTRLFAQDGSEKALNRCEVPALQRKELERTSKEQPCSLRTVGYGWVGMGDGGWKRVAWSGDKKGFLQMKTFSVCEKGGFFCSCKAMPK